MRGRRGARLLARPVHRFFTSKWRINAPSGRRIRIFTPGRSPADETLAHFRDSSLVSARDPSLPRVARFFWARPSPEACRADNQAPWPTTTGHATAHADADPRRLGGRLALIVAFMAAEVVGRRSSAHSLALLSDAGHMLTDAVAHRAGAGRPAAGPAAAGGQLHLRAEAGRDPLGAGQRDHAAAARRADRLRGHPAADRAARRRGRAGADRRPGRDRGEPGRGRACSPAPSARSLNVEGAFRHILTDLFAFIATAIAGAVILISGLRPRRRDRLAADRRADALGRLRPAARLRPGLHGGRAAGPRSRADRRTRWPPSRASSRCTTCTSGR